MLRFTTLRDIIPWTRTANRRESKTAWSYSLLGMRLITHMGRDKQYACRGNPAFVVIIHMFV